jgi:hypothetical protein
MKQHFVAEGRVSAPGGGLASGRLVHSIGTALWLCAAMKWLRAGRTCFGEVKLAPCNALRLRMLDQYSIWLSRSACVGVN